VLFSFADVCGEAKAFLFNDVAPPGKVRSDGLDGTLIAVRAFPMPHPV
jgi:hypothetical protein